ncbi:glycosyltransferase [Flavobacteriaceae bacterium R38]|nr:glycosyltransferase [Flavobacteriaceae bacterium R38]
MKFAIVILNWNGRKLLEQFLPSVITHSKGADIYLADNASSDESIAFVRQNFPSVIIIENEANDGYAKGYNDALQKVEADIYCLLNSDVEVTEGWLKPVEEVFVADHNTAIVQPKILDYKNKEYFEYAGGGGGFIDRLGYPFCRGRIFQTLEKDNGQYDDTVEIFWASGACFFVKSDVFWEMCGFDEDYFAHQEEIDFCWRVRNNNYKVMYTGESHVFHVGGATLSNMNPQKTYLNFRNSLFSITKNLPKRKFFPLLFARLILDGIAATRFIFQFKFEHFFAIFRAHLSYYKKIVHFFKKRKNIPKRKKYYVITSIVWAYFVLNKRRFNILIKH